MEKYDNWFLEQGFVGGVTSSHDPVHWYSMSYSKGEKIINGGWVAGSTPRWWAYNRAYMTPVFDTPWAALAYADLCGWGRTAAAQGELELEMLGCTWIRTGVQVAMYPGEPATPEVHWRYPAGTVVGARVDGMYMRLRDIALNSGDVLRLNLTCGYI